LRQAGADRVVTGEGEVALAMTEAVLRELGATAEQIDRKRERLRTDLLGGAPAMEVAEPRRQPPVGDAEAPAPTEGQPVPREQAAPPSGEAPAPVGGPGASPS